MQTIEERRRIFDDAITKRIITDYTKQTQEAVETLADQGIRITQPAFEKLEAIVEEFDTYAQKESQEEQEVYLFNASDPGSEVVNDVYIAQDQEVDPADCDVSAEGVVSSEVALRSEKKIISGWSHSHARNKNFFSPKDKRESKNLLLTYGFSREINDVSLRYLNAIVVNSAREDPWGVLAIRHPFYFAEGEKIIRGRQVSFYKVPLHIIDGPKLERLNYRSLFETRVKIREFAK